MKKKIYKIVSIFFVALLLAGCGQKQPAERHDSLTQYISVLIDDYNSDIVILGDDKYLDERLIHRKVDRIDATTMQYDSSVHGYQALAILDMENNLSISDEEFAFIEDYVKKQHKDILYFGRQYMQRLEEIFNLGGHSSEPGIGVYGSIPENKQSCGWMAMDGVWTDEINANYKKVKSNLAFCITSEFARTATGEMYAPMLNKTE